MTILGTAAFAILVLATIAAFLVAEHLKGSPLAIRQRFVTTRYSPFIQHQRASIRVELAHKDVVTLTVVDDRGRVVRSIANRWPEPGGRPLQFFWDGRNSSTQQVSAGHYDVRIHLARLNRTLRLHYGITVLPPSRRAARSAKPYGSPRRPGL